MKIKHLDLTCNGSSGVIPAERVIPKPVWCSTRMLKGKRASRTPGKIKGPTCQTEPVKKFFLTHPHAWKHPQYGVWCRKVRLMNEGKLAGTH